MTAAAPSLELLSVLKGMSAEWRAYSKLDQYTLGLESAAAELDGILDAYTRAALQADPVGDHYRDALQSIASDFAHSKGNVDRTDAYAQTALDALNTPPAAALQADRGAVVVPYSHEVTWREDDAFCKLRRYFPDSKMCGNFVQWLREQETVSDIEVIPLFLKPLTAAPAAVPAGFVLVPVEPTEEMLAEACVFDTDKRTAETDQWNRDTWGWMIAAAPKPEAQS